MEELHGLNQMLLQSYTVEPQQERSELVTALHVNPAFLGRVQMDKVHRAEIFGLNASEHLTLVDICVSASRVEDKPSFSRRCLGILQ